MPALTISTDNAMRSRSSSPNPPPVSPITPTLPPTRLPGDDNTSNRSGSNGGGPAPAAAAAAATAQQSMRRVLTHSQPDQIAIPPPPPVPISLDSNPDAIALMSTISVLQLQQRRATADIQALSRAKDDAIEHPEEFVRHLMAGKVRVEPNAARRSTRDGDSDNEAGGEGPSSSQTRAWASLPKPQDVVRCPPINWSQYAVVGESLDKLHAEQVARPTQGTPAVIGAGGMYEFKGGDGKQERYNGVAAPYSPLKDKIDRKPKGKK